MSIPTVKQRLLKNLHLWEENPKDIAEGMLDELAESIKLKGQIIPLLVMPDGTILGGNSSYKAMSRVGIQVAEVYEVFFTQNDQGLWVPTLNDQRQLATYVSEKDGMWDYAVAHNAQYGYYVREKLKAGVQSLNLDLQRLHVSVKTVTLKDAVTPRDLKPPKFNVIIPCETEEDKNMIKNRLAELGIRTK